jgi:seryl-tRNA synthetase
MLDIKLIRENSKLIKESQKKRGLDEKDVDAILELDERWRKLKNQDDDLRHERNKISKEINEAKKAGESGKDIIKKAKEISLKLKSNEEEEKELEVKLRKLMLDMPNILDKAVPKGKDASKNKELSKWGKKLVMKNPKSHVELGEALDILDIKRATKVTGAGFYFFKKELAVLQRALIQFMLDFHRSKGKLEIVSPILANSETAEGTAHLPKFDEDMYKTREGFYLIPTAEMTLTNLHREENLVESELPIRYYGYTPCFRTEAGRHGAETPGIFRVHQFDKVEMVTLCTPEESDEEFKTMVNDAQEILKKLEVPHRIIVLCSGDIGSKEAITYDLETWSPYLKKYMETSSVSKIGDFQARRMNSRYQSKEGLKFIHTLNGSGLALPRLIISLLENNQTKEGSIKVPKALHKYTGFKEIKAAKKPKK